MGGSQKRSFSTLNTEIKLEERRPSQGVVHADSDPSMRTVATPHRHAAHPGVSALPATSSASETSGAQNLLKQRAQARCQMAWSAPPAAGMGEKGSESVPSSVRMTPQQSEPQAAGDDLEEEEGESDDQMEKRQMKNQPRRPHLQGRFSGRLETKEDEKRLADECRMLGPFLGGVGKRGEKSRLTLAKIVRGIASGDVRRHCEERERKLAALQERVDALEADRSRQRGGPLEDGAVLMKGELLGKQYSIAGTTPSANGLAANVLLPAMSSSGLHPVPGQAAPFHPKQASVGPQESGIARTSSSGGCLVTSTSGGPLVLVSGPPVVPAVSSLPHPSTPVQASRSAASEAQALAQEAAQLKAQAQNFKAHADHLQEQSEQAQSEPVQVQAAVQAQSFQAKAQSLEKAAEAQNLQAQAVAHAQAQAEAHAQAQHLAAKAHVHAQARMEAAAQANHLKNVAQYDGEQTQQVVAQTQHLEAKAQGHAQAQSQLVVHAHNLTAKAHAHATAQAQAQAQAQQAAEEACHLDAAAQQLQAEAHLVASKGTLVPQQLHPDQQYTGMGVVPVSNMGSATGQQLDQVASSMQLQQGVHLQGSSPLPGAALSVPHSELDDSQLILAAAEVRFEDGAAMAAPQHNVLFNGTQQHVAPVYQGVQHRGSAQVASPAVQLPSPASGQLQKQGSIIIQTPNGYDHSHSLDSVQQIGTVLEVVPAALHDSVAASSSKMLSFLDGAHHAPADDLPQEAVLPSAAMLLPADQAGLAMSTNIQSDSVSFAVERPSTMSISFSNAHLAPVVTLQSATAGSPLSTPRKPNADAACRIDFLSHM